MHDASLDLGNHRDPSGPLSATHLMISALYEAFCSCRCVQLRTRSNGYVTCVFGGAGVYVQGIPGDFWIFPVKKSI